MPAKRSVIFVHGCFWHRHAGCKRATVPLTRQEYWIPKLERNVQRDRKAQRELKKLGWRVLTVWECELASLSRLESKLRRFLDPA